MKRLIRIPLGIIFSPIMLFLGTWIWLFETNTRSWIEQVGITIWYLISGQWNEFLDQRTIKTVIRKYRTTKIKIGASQ